MNTSKEITTVANALMSVAQCMAESQSQSVRTRKIAQQYVRQFKQDIERAKIPQWFEHQASAKQGMKMG